ncbi:hypothetical protein KC356_g204 [Hortaea werneckii]|nr:hypothetical protein KC356_g204 [Hortaea werneckii]
MRFNEDVSDLTDLTPTFTLECRRRLLADTSVTLPPVLLLIFGNSSRLHHRPRDSCRTRFVLHSKKLLRKKRLLVPNPAVALLQCQNCNRSRRVFAVFVELLLLTPVTI